MRRRYFNYTHKEKHYIIDVSDIHTMGPTGGVYHVSFYSKDNVMVVPVEVGCAIVEYMLPAFGNKKGLNQ